MTNDILAGVATIAAEGPLAAFMTSVVADPAAQARLAVSTTVPDYIDAAIAQASAYGIALSPADIDDRLRPDPLGLSRFAAAPVTLDRWPGRAWMPTRSVPQSHAPAIDWAWFGDAPLAEPLYEESVRRATGLPFNRMFRTRTSLAALVGDAIDQDVRNPAGFVFHMSRCGSTLAGRMLMAVPGHAVASEPEPLDAMLQWAVLSGASHDDQVAALRAIVAALGRERTVGQRRFFLKLDAWHALMLPLFRAAFPDVPWIFLYRDPVEVIMSHMAEPGVHYGAGTLPPPLLGLDTNEWTSEADYCARILGRICVAVAEHWSLGGGMLVPFDDIYAAMLTTVPTHFGFEADAGERVAMTTATAVNAKRPSAPFSPDSADKHNRASPDVIAAAATHLGPIIASLDKLRGNGVRPVDYS